jgi:hypothetical protein
MREGEFQLDPQSADRFASMLLYQNGHEAWFEVQLESKQILDQVADALLCKGCDLKLDYQHLSVLVHAPEPSLDA